MTTTRRLLGIAAAALPAAAQAQSPAPAARAPQGFMRGYPTPQTSRAARDDADFQRAVTAYRFWYPTVSAEGILNGLREVGIQDGRSFAILTAGPRHVGFTANSDTPYGVGVLDLSEGPVVIEMPPGAFIGLVDDQHQGWVMDMGIPGPDEGRGGKHLVLPPGYAEPVPEGYYVGRSVSRKAFAAVRALPADGNAQAALDAMRRIRIYPLATAGNPRLMEFVDVSERRMDGTCLRWEDNLQFWEVLRRVLDAEAVVPQFLPMYSLLSELGIEKGKPFAPDARLRGILARAARVGRDQLLVSAFDSDRPDRLNWPDRKWEWAGLVPGSAQFETPAGIDLEARDRWFAQAIVTSPAMFRRNAGAGSLYWLGARDRTGAFLDGERRYRLTIPQPVPAGLFWSVTIYDSQTRSQVQTPQDKAALRSLFELRDLTGQSSLDLHFGPTQPANTGNRWLRTAPGRGWFAYIRIYGPQQAAFDRSWKPGDFERVG